MRRRTNNLRHGSRATALPSLLTQGQALSLQTVADILRRAQEACHVCPSPDGSALPHRLARRDSRRGGGSLRQTGRRLPRVRLPSSTCSSGTARCSTAPARRATRADVGINGDRIAAVGKLASRDRAADDRRDRAHRRARLHRPPHPLRDAAPRRRHGAEQGAPGRHARHHGREHVRRAARRPDRSAGGDGVTPDWTTFTGYFERLEKQGISMNVISHIASEQVRRVVLGYDTREPTRAGARADEAARGALDGRRRVGSGDALRERRSRASARGHRDGQGGARYGGNYTSHTGSEGFEQKKEFDVCDPRRRGSEGAGPHLPLQDPREAALGHDRPATSSRSRTRARAG